MSCCSKCGKSGCTCIDGFNAFTTLSADFTQPSVGSLVTVSVTNLGQLSGRWIGLGNVVHIVGGGWYLVTDVSGSPQQFVLQNLGYANNAAPGATVSQNGLVVSGGLVGPTGAAGTDGTSVLFNNHTAVTLLGSAGTGSQTAFTYNMPDGTLNPNGSILEVDFLVDRTASSPLPSQGGNMVVSIGAQPVASLSFFIAQESSRMRAKVEVHRISATTVRVDVVYTLYNPSSQFVEGVSSYTTSSTVTVPDLDSGGPRAVVLAGSVGNASDNFVCRFMTVRRNRT